jgi:hypothetical protein
VLALDLHSSNTITEDDMHRYAIIGFGSLLWDLDTLRPQVVGSWEYYTGPALPLEFSLISQKRNYALALDIDFEHGTPCPTCVIKSRRNIVAETVMDLAVRERAPIKVIGFYDRDSGNGRSRSESTLEQIRNWVESSSWDGAVWTDGASNFRTVTGIEFSVAGACEYLRSLSDASLVDAKHYIENAPDRVDTPLRRALAQESWWHKLPS